MDIAIIGAGLAGLTAAYELADHTVTVFEADERIGGKLHTVPFSAGPVDMGAEAFLNYRADAREFFDSLDLPRVYPSQATPAVYALGALQALPMADTIMGIPASSEAVAHLVSEETARRIDEDREVQWEAGGDRSLGELVAEAYGRDLVTRLVDPLLGGVYSCLADDLGVRATVPALAGALDAQEGPVRLGAAVRAVLDARPPRNPDNPIFGTFPGGYKDLYETLAERSGAEIYLGEFITAITPTASGRYEVAGREFDRVILAVPAPTAAALLRQANPEAAAELAQIRLASSAVVGFRFASDEGLPNNSGILVATDAGLSAKAFTFSSRKWPHLAAGGGALVRASFGRFGDDAITRAEEEELIDTALADLETITGFAPDRDTITDIYVQRWFGGLPRYDHEHLARVERIRGHLESTPHLAAIGAWNGGVGVPDVIAGARAAAARIR
ncbi:protoporphyrinogen oxidase [Corynebacterium sp. 13CS0277]|uniref:FAD-dependent oxidoreductase n=1 Tax=Corynebacterium sp. 13CS0277 TaxID=2071994 RepID=UPI000D024F2C|nr:FAD-dependent oxidoreductase [Corynebacterium sp. 13CS0277]PRQ10673.1 protoporphyrinogen oxidase [Corynebacterium sp. 13CS0277]